MNGTVAAIVTAAGLSRRMGCCKQLLDLGGKTVLARCLDTLLAGGLTQVVVVVGPGNELVAAEASRFPVEVVVNPARGGDMASSVLVGRRLLAPHITGTIVALCDYPLVSPATISYLASVHGAAPTAILVPRHGGQKGHPTLFPSALLDELSSGGTLRDILARHHEEVRLLDTGDPGILLDMDTPEDYRRLHRMNLDAGGAAVT